MLKESSFYGITNWKCFQTENISFSTIESFKQSTIQNENAHGYIVLFKESKVGEALFSVECYKKHASSILKFIVIGKFPIEEFNRFRTEADRIIKQTALLEELIQKPENFRYGVERKKYFNLPEWVF